MSQSLQPADGTDVLRFKMYHRGYKVLALTLAFIAGVLVVLGLFGQIVEEDRVQVLALAGVFLVGAAPLGLRAWLIARGGGTGLRLDPQGMSGYVLPKAFGWDEIEGFGLVQAGRDGRGVALAMSLRDPHKHKIKRQALLQPVDPAEPFKYDLVLATGRIGKDPREMHKVLNGYLERYGHVPND